VNNRTKGPIIVLVLVVVFAVGAALISYYLHSFQKVTISPPTGNQITLYQGVAGEEERINYDKNKVVFAGSEKITKNIKKGYYVYVVDPMNKDYSSNTTPIDIGDKPVAIAPKLNFTDDKLAGIAQSKLPEITNFLLQKYPVTMRSYSVDRVNAYEAGEWIGVSLTPKSPSLDIMVAIFSIKDSQLSLVTDPPSIIIAQPVYPNIPSSVISNTNRLAQNFNQ
jgi:hypothetical protein